MSQHSIDTSLPTYVGSSTPFGVATSLRIRIPPSGIYGTSVPTQQVCPAASGAGGNPFVEGMDAAASICFGENGCPEWTDVGVCDYRVAFFFKLMRGLSQEDSNIMISNIIASATVKSDIHGFVDLFCLMWQTRDIRGGKGEKELFYNFFMKMYEEFPGTCIRQLSLISHYGYWKDCLALLGKIYDFQVEGVDYTPLVDAIYGLMVEQFKKDMNTLEKSKKDGTVPILSLLGKWLPRQGKVYDRKLDFCRNFVLVFGLLNTSTVSNPRSMNWAMMKYRRMCAELNKVLRVPEVMMAGRRWGEIKFSDVASRCMLKCRKAFMNELLETIPGQAYDITGDRYPQDPDRIACRANLVKALTDKGLHGKVLMPHEIVTKIGPYVPISRVEKIVLQKQWEAIIAGVRENIETTVESMGIASGTGTSSINLGNLVPLVDVSGSMTGIPMEVAIAMGLIVSEMANPAFRHRFMTFSEKPTWVNVTDCTDIYSKVLKTRSAPWGYNTNLEKAMCLICNVVRANRLSADHVPDLIVFSDMQFDKARNSNREWATMHRVIVQMFADVGRDICGKPYDPPTITYWNLRSGTVGFPVQADTPGVRMISGFSPALLKLILSGEPMETDETVMDKATGEMATRTRRVTPYETFRKAMDDPLYDPVRVSVHDVGEVADRISGDLRRFAIRRQLSFVEAASGAASGAAAGDGV
jgi:hypothetical protein